MKHPVPILSLLFLLSALACSDGGDPVSPGNGNPSGGGDGGNDSTQVSFSADVLPILTASCASVGCHGAGSRSGDLSLDAGDAYGESVGAVSFGYAPALRIAAGDPSGSVLYQKLVGNPSFGVRMPYGGAPLAADEIATIRAWIEQGARDD